MSTAAIQSKSKLFEPATLGSIELSNRVIMAPMTRSRAINNIPNTLMATYYTQRATAGLIITEGIAPSANGLGYSRIPGLYSNEQVEAWKEITTAVHQNGGKIFAQLMHTGRISHSANMPKGSVIVAPSAIAARGDMWTDSDGMQPMPIPRAMTQTDIETAINEFVNAAQNAIDAGFDGIELHGANGYLLEQFLNPNTNHRTDNYGGSLINRTRFVIDVAKAVGDKIGYDKVGVRISPYSTYNDKPAYDEVVDTYSHLSKELQKIGIVYLHVVDYAARASEEGLTLLDTIRKNFSNILILNAGYTADRAAEVLANGQADLVSFGSAFLANPNLPHKLKHNLPLAVPDTSTFFTADAAGYTDYPVE
jgi:N-ethylmaleimide reductase